jgi:hypothetical protein
VVNKEDTMPDETPFKTRPTTDLVAISCPSIWTEVVSGKNASLFQIHHPDHGWLTFLLRPEDSELLGRTLIKHAALIEYFNGSLPPSTVTVN